MTASPRIQFPQTFSCLMPSPDATADLAARIAPCLRAGDALLLSGPIGAGKTHFARSVIQTRLRATDQLEDVPSPTFTLVQTYQAGDLEIWHADLYRLGGAADADELGLQDAFDTALTLIEWPDRLGLELPANRLEIDFQTLAQLGHRRLTVRVIGPNWADRLSDLARLFDD